MCLDYIEKRANRMPKTLVGYKIVLKQGDKYSSYWGYCPHPYKEKLSMCKKPLRIGRSDIYLSGIHAYVKLGDALHRFFEGTGRAIIKVRLTGPIAYGKENSADVVVYKHARVMSEVKCGTKD